MVVETAVDRTKLAKAYDNEVMPRWEEYFVPFLLELFPEKLPEKCTLLEVGCTSGRLTEEILKRLTATDRLIAVDDIRELMDIARRKVGDDDRKRVFFKKERPGSLSFADGAFDGVLSSGLPSEYSLQEVLHEGSRLLRKDGFLLFGFALQGSFQELFDVFREVLEKEDLIPAQEGLDKLAGRLPNRAAASRLMGKSGLVDCEVAVREQAIHYEDGLALVRSPLVRQHCLDECLSLIRDRGWREGILAGMIKTLDTYFPEGIDMTLVMSRLFGVKP